MSYLTSNGFNLKSHHCGLSICDSSGKTTYTLPTKKGNEGDVIVVSKDGVQLEFMSYLKIISEMTDELSKFTSELDVLRKEHKKFTYELEELRNENKELKNMIDKI